MASIWSFTALARLSFSTNGSVMLLIDTGNCDITAWPSTSAVIAVPSEI
jgi:hypothetical protein